MNALPRASLGCLLCLTTLACSVDSAEGMTSLTGSSSAGSFTSMSEADTGASTSTTDDTSASSDTQAEGSATEGTGDGDGDSATDTSATDTGATDTSTGDGDGDASSGDGDGSSGSGGGSPLDPDLDLPPEGNTPCTTPGSLNECPSTEVCRFFDTESGRCESCDACGNLNAFCNEGTDCDILFACYQNTCTNFCSLGTSECGAVADCLDVGHPTRGVCAP